MTFEGIAVATSVRRWKFGIWRPGDGSVWFHVGPLAFAFS